MKQSEQTTVNELAELVRSLRSENAQFQSDVTSQVEAIKEKTDKKHLPVTLEQDILMVAQQSIQEAIGKSLSNYDSPIALLVKEVVGEHKDELKGIINTAFAEAIRTENFKASIVSAFSHKVARTIILNNDSLLDKVSNELKQDKVFKSRATVAVANVVESCLKDSK